MMSDVVYVIGWTFGQYSNKCTMLVGFAPSRSVAQRFVDKAQEVVDAIVKLDIVDDLPWGLYNDNQELTEEDWKTIEKEVGAEAAGLLADLLELDPTWLGNLHGLRDYDAPKYTISAVSRVTVTRI